MDPEQKTVETRLIQLYVCACFQFSSIKLTIIYAKFGINLYVGDYENIFVKTGQQVALSNQCATPRPNVGLASEFGRELVYVMAAELCTEKPRHGQYPCVAGTLLRETEAWTVPMCSRDFAQRNRGMDSTHV